jgi:hypothetical protein
MTVQCCKCKRILVDGHWVRPTTDIEGPMSHSYCPQCLLEATIEIFNERASGSHVRQARDLVNNLPVTAST